MSIHVSHQPPEFEPGLLSAQSLRRLRLSTEPFAVEEVTAETPGALSSRGNLVDDLLDGIKRRWFRERRRRKVGRAYDMALEIARVIPKGSEVLDIGCGNGFIAHHLSAMLGTNVLGIDLEPSTEAPIDYVRYDGACFPARDNSFDAVLLCYVLHHAQDVGAVMKEICRVLRKDGLAIIYEDIPETWWDRFVCSLHNRQWKGRTGACTFRSESEWRSLFEEFGFEVTRERQLARMRNLTHPVKRRFYLLRLSSDSAGSSRRKSSAYHPRQSSMCDRNTALERY
jgi:ubiquinone/menaquinone biosynthesis C-methylase UbiE